jgi:hypothetical protein
MILDANGKPFIPNEKPKMHKCLFCGRRSRLGTKCCNARYREDSKFNAETRHQRLNRLEQEKAREEIRGVRLHRDGSKREVETPVR